MGLYDRPYWRDGGGGGIGGEGGSRGGGLMIGMPKPGRAVKTLLIINIAVFVVQMVADHPRAGYPAGILSAYFGVTAGAFWQVWRYLTCQFLHSTEYFWHILLNMLGLYMLGAPLEQRWGSRGFVRFYLTCGVVAGAAYAGIGNVVGLNPNAPIIGASGGVFGVILACAVLFPHFRIILLFFPVPIRFASLIIFGGMGLVILSAVGSGRYTGQFWSDVAHLGGALTAAFWIWGLPKLRGTAGEARARRNRGAWERKLKKRAQERAEIDCILEKIHDSGINSLTGREKKILRQATNKQQEGERELYRL